MIYVTQFYLQWITTVNAEIHQRKPIPPFSAKFETSYIKYSHIHTHLENRENGAEWSIIPLQRGCSPVQVPLARHTTLLGPTSWNPGLQVKWTSWSTKYLLPNFLPLGGASRAGQETVKRRAGIRTCRPELQPQKHG